ncbi:uracil-DNA glycosylase [bacterium]|nr:uracil-DNA glycosylase [bacterium]
MKYLNFNETELTNELKETSLLEVRNVCLQCYNCPLGEKRTNIVFSDGQANAPIMLIGEAPGADEDETGIPFVGRAGKLLTQLLTESGISREKDLYICNTVKCRPPENREPKPEEKNACEKYLEAQINIVRPKLIVLCGATAAKNFLGENLKISEIRGNKYNLFGQIPATVIFHPSYLLRNHSEEVNSPRWLTRKDLKAIKDFIDNLK